PPIWRTKNAPTPLSRAWLKQSPGRLEQSPGRLDRRLFPRSQFPSAIGRRVVPDRADQMQVSNEQRTHLCMSRRFLGPILLPSPTLRAPSRYHFLQKERYPVQTNHTNNPNTRYWQSVPG